MAHLICTEHKRRSLVFVGSKGYPRITHRSDGSECVNSNPGRWETVQIFGRELLPEYVLDNADGAYQSLSGDDWRVGWNRPRG